MTKEVFTYLEVLINSVTRNCFINCSGVILLLFKLQKKTQKNFVYIFAKRFVYYFYCKLLLLSYELWLFAILHYQPFPTFNTSEEPSSLFPRWERYKKRFNLLCAAIGVDNDPQKLSMLLTYIGDEAYENL